MRGRLLGALCVLASCVSMGAAACAEKRRRLNTLDELTAALRRMRAELASHARPTAELCRLLAESSAGETETFFALLLRSLDQLGERPFYVLWREAAFRALRSLREEERQSLERLGDSLGRYALEEQVSAVESCLAALDSARERARAELPVQRKLTLGLALSAGAMLTILLL